MQDHQYPQSNHYPKISIIIPAKYEEKTIIRTMKEIKKNVKTQHEIILVNDSSDDDKTGEIAKKSRQLRGFTVFTFVLRIK